MTRETIYAALYAKLTAIPGIVTTGRRLKHWSDVPAEQQPALYLIQRNETPSQVKGVPAKWSLKADLYLYVNTGNDENIAPATLLNPLLDAIEAVLAVEPFSGFQTLGGLVSHAWIAGTIETSEGVLGNQEVAIIPIEILPL